MFDYVDMLQGPSKGAVDSDDESADANTGVSENQAQDKPAGNFSFWGMATALAENVKKSTADIATRCVGCRLPLSLKRCGSQFGYWVGNIQCCTFGRWHTLSQASKVGKGPARAGCCWAIASAIAVSLQCTQCQGDRLEGGAAVLLQGGCGGLRGGVPAGAQGAGALSQRGHCPPARQPGCRAGRPWRARDRQLGCCPSAGALQQGERLHLSLLLESHTLLRQFLPQISTFVEVLSWGGETQNPS